MQIYKRDLKKRGWTDEMMKKYLPQPKMDINNTACWNKTTVYKISQMEEVKKSLEDNNRKWEERRRKKEYNRTHNQRVEWIEHNKDIISDNIFHALKSGEYTEEEISAYRKESRKALTKLRRYIGSGGIPVLDNESGLYVIPKAG